MATIRTFSILTLGCKVNQYESAQIREFLENKGLFWIKPEEKPDLFVVNTCCVTSTASAKSRQYIQRAKRQNVQAVLVICGCLAAQQTPQKGQAGELRLQENDAIHLVANRDTLAAKLQEIIAGARSPVPVRDAQRQRDALRRGRSFTNSAKIASISQHCLIKPESNQEINTFADLTSLPKLPLLTSFKEHTRAFLKVQDGCDGVCSYCIVPKVRPNVQSKPFFEAITEAKALVAAGHKEIVVTGVNLGAYGRDTCRGRPMCLSNTPLPNTFVDLLTELAKIEGLRRIRVSSLEPGDISEGLLDVFCKYTNIMSHIHLSVQSGSDAILRRMCRQYSAAELRGKIDLIKRRLDRPAITCDLIVGFPGETEENFQQTVELAKWAGFSKMHIFPFSAREGTAAAKMKDKVQPKVIKERSEILRRVGEELGFKFREQFVGETCEVLLENTEPMSGRCERYFVVFVDSLLLNQSKNHSGAGKGEVRSEKLEGGEPGFAQSGDDKSYAGTRGATPRSSRPQSGASLRYEKNEIAKVRITANRRDGTLGIKEI